MLPTEEETARLINLIPPDTIKKAMKLKKQALEEQRRKTQEEKKIQEEKKALEDVSSDLGDDMVQHIMRRKKQLQEEVKNEQKPKASEDVPTPINNLLRLNDIQRERKIYDIYSEARKKITAQYNLAHKKTDTKRFEMDVNIEADILLEAFCNGK